MSTRQIERGDIYYVHLSGAIGSEQAGTRPCVIVQNNTANAKTPTTQVVPLTGILKIKHLNTHVIISNESGLKQDSMALAEQVRTVDKRRLSEYVGRISDSEEAEIDYALACSLGL